MLYEQMLETQLTRANVYGGHKPMANTYFTISDLSHSRKVAFNVRVLIFYHQNFTFLYVIWNFTNFLLTYYLSSLSSYLPNFYTLLHMTWLDMSIKIYVTRIMNASARDL